VIGAITENYLKIDVQSAVDSFIDVLVQEHSSYDLRHQEFEALKAFMRHNYSQNVQTLIEPDSSPFTWSNFGQIVSVSAKKASEFTDNRAEKLKLDELAGRAQKIKDAHRANKSIVKVNVLSSELSPESLISEILAAETIQSLKKEL
jgi:hypothetical protein